MGALLPLKGRLLAALNTSGGELLPAVEALLAEQDARQPAMQRDLDEAVKSRDLIYESRQEERARVRLLTAEVLALTEGRGPTGDVIVVRAPHVMSGPKGVPVSVADADYMRSAIRNIEYQQTRRNSFSGSGVTAAVLQLLGDAAAALEAIAAEEAPHV